MQQGNQTRTIQLPDGTTLPAIGQGTWYMGEKQSSRREEVQALRYGIERGMTVIDTAEMYAEGGAEEVTGEAIKDCRDDVFLVSKVYPHHADRKQMITACERSLSRLGTDRLDLYLLHWRGGVPLEETVEALEQLKQSGKILRWGVSNLDTEDMQELWNIPAGQHCAVNQVLYHAASRGIEYELLPWLRERRIPVMAYCPLAQGGRLRKELLEHSVIREIAKDRGVSPSQIALSWVIRDGDILAIPKAVQLNHVAENAAAMDVILTQDEVVRLNEAFPAPKGKVPLDIV
ncbi:Aldo/keto reductase [Paenibacillus sp. ov031]|uniref:Diketogulonate reductase-like aldo/keto reductase n=1 Tax=Paenibacillus pabuli TaxID=1472 RepID=A0ABX9BHG6_9BACL|nr:MULTISPECIES: aldo/keto reductase [Paenibacillus]MCZ1263302.1 aldo/keto reductase [Paenibacillus tundrae]RAI93548.1 diketogulonate reductase-like aldo/keto reductase [Paenibacillus pabuli]SDL20064.1 Aldo/keto reductase [Paenibacillus sp. OK060]SHN81229.1 Aldo/keto reductase [Paenibacillus sp. ov031]